MSGFNTNVIWDASYSVRFVEQKAWLYENGKLVAVEGDRLDLGGGLIQPKGSSKDSFCVPDADDRVWLANPGAEVQAKKPGQ